MAKSAKQKPSLIRRLPVTPEVQSDLIKISEAASVAGMTHQGIRKAIQKGDLPVYEIGGMQFVLRNDAETYQPANASGRPRSRAAAA
jgi:hypothetical protein